MGGIKIHASIDMLIQNNHISHCDRGLWLDWMSQGCRVRRNLFHHNTRQDLFVEVNHGPFLVDNNIMLSDMAIRDMSQGGAYVHNLLVGNIEVIPVPDRETPYHFPHQTKLAGLQATKCGDNRFYNNIFVGGATGSKNSCSGLGAYKNTELPMWVNGNVYLNRAEPFDAESNKLVLDYT